MNKNRDEVENSKTVYNLLWIAIVGAGVMALIWQNGFPVWLAQFLR